MDQRYEFKRYGELREPESLGNLGIVGWCICLLFLLGGHRGEPLDASHSQSFIQPHPSLQTVRLPWLLNVSRHIGSGFDRAYLSTCSISSTLPLCPSQHGRHCRHSGDHLV